jgi:hypothetical protein
LLKAIGILVRLHFDEKTKSPRFNRNNKLNAFQISQTLLEKALEIGIETEGLKSLDRKIKESLDLLETEARNGL